MIRIFFAGDGPRDEATVPPLVRSILSTEVESAGFSPWARLNGAGRGYQKKVRFATLQAIDARAAALVAVVDRDKAEAGHRMDALRAARDADRTKKPAFPTAFGEANPHGEAWLLDDPVAVREALGLNSEDEIVSVKRTKDPKGILDALIEKSRHRGHSREALAEIATRVNPSRCQHPDHTGFREFTDELHLELGPLTTA